jgi:hypothetical protein
LLAGCVLYAVSKLSTPKVATVEMYTREFISEDGGKYKIAVQSIVNPANLNKFGGYWFSPRDGDRPFAPLILLLWRLILINCMVGKPVNSNLKFPMCLVPYGSSKMPV